MTAPQDDPPGPPPPGGRSVPRTRASGRHRAPGWLDSSGPTAWVVTLAARSALGVAVSLLLWTLLPALGGWQSSLVLSGSMEPSFVAGDVAVVRPVADADLRLRQVLLVEDPDRPGELRLHRLVGIDGDSLILRGDANAAADSTPVLPRAVRGAVVLRIPAIGLPATWAAEGRVVPLVGTALLALAVLAAAGWHRPRERTQSPGVAELLDRLGLGAIPRAASAHTLVPKVAAALAVVSLLPLIGTAGTASAAPYAGAAITPGNNLATTRYYSCVNAAFDGEAAAPGPVQALRYHDLQQTIGTTSANRGSAGTGANGTYVNAPVFTASGPPNCGPSGTRAVTFNGTNEWVNTTLTGAAPTNVSVAIWFQTSTTTGGRLIGFGNSTNTGGGRASTTADRHLYMTNSGQIAFGVLNGATRNAVVSPAGYRDGAWHHAVGTLSASGMVLYVDGVQVGASAATTTATAASYTGAWRVAYDVLTGWPSAPTSPYFAGTLAHAAVYPGALSATDVAAHYRAGS